MNSTEPVTPRPQISDKLLAGFSVSHLVFSVLWFPFSTTLIKYRVNYVPRRVSLDGERSRVPESGEGAVKSYFGMLKKVLRVEGFSGFYKGFMPWLLEYIVCLVIDRLHVKFFFSMSDDGAFSSSPRNRVYRIFETLLFLPVKIVAMRATTCSYKLPWFDSTVSLNALLTEAEHQRPWLLFLAPGVLVLEALALAYDAYAFSHFFTKIIAPNYGGDKSVAKPRRSLARFVSFLCFAALNVTVKCFLDVVSARLCVQRNDQTGDDASSVSKITKRDVAGNLPYTGFVDCVQRIVNEEGLSALFRAWWYDLIMRYWWLPFLF
ncbi:hypothetical protein ACEPAI_9648 [Sanghuangporus weigelae]